MLRTGLLTLGLGALLGCEEPPAMPEAVRIAAPEGTPPQLRDTHMANAPVDAGVLDDHRWVHPVPQPHPRRFSLPLREPVDAGRR